MSELTKATEPETADARRESGLKIHHLRPAPGAHKAKTRVGRGEASKGKTAGRGTKGSKARKQVPARFEGGQMPLHMRVPKLKGFRNRFRTEYQVVNVATLAELFPDGGEIGVDDLARAGAVRRNSLVKVLGDGEIGIALSVRAHAFSASAKEKITAVGGSVTEI
ncbi:MULTISPECIES: 50S ribosomal protein L15 [Protofrankia]|uniref:Large ribosomal subunit protein uL15 n=1 Tax=Candidatus Protofrankia datiscae TaxID=2716812 RepID=F8AV10_9ACTN|nr:MULTISPECIES: 50S ribosomal protein L15 [Protofrankia]AEH11217.1 ribosomal protein L15 [Candidatus Protofrankia datiscae]